MSAIEPSILAVWLAGIIIVVAFEQGAAWSSRCTSSPFDNNNLFFIHLRNFHKGSLKSKQYVPKNIIVPHTPNLSGHFVLLPVQLFVDLSVLLSVALLAPVYFWPTFVFLRIIRAQLEPLATIALFLD